ncbi:DNA-binding SARP family transcriptional activator/ActR/RegA family two-component response regulator [Arthrobacter sp. PL16]|uniref:response regulator n=1 Tax=Arthrobacter sp. PL16 TaxID=3071720 RepID=UPI002DF96B29|nr:DNA-binding SARP family transcriptional activator/ActR/RegA family two-component response regulator [Arthrobacter sp. PL16]
MIALEFVGKKTDLAQASEASRQSSALQIKVLGPLAICIGGTTLNANDLGGPKPRQVLEILLLNFGSAVSKTRMIDLLWNGNPPAGALPTLESYVSVLRRRLQPGAGRAGPLRTVTGGYVIEPSIVDLDLNRFHTLTRLAGVAAPPDALPLLTEALELASAQLLGDELLPAWAEEERALHAERVGHARVLAAETALLVGEVGKAIAWGSEAAREDPLNERAWTALILGLEQNGENTEALRIFDRCRRVMDEELGCAPSEVLKKAQARLLTTTRTTSGPTTPRAPTRVVTEDRSKAQPLPRPETERLRILIVDDHTTFSDLLAGALDREPDFESVGAAKTVESAATMYLELRPDVVVMDLYLDGGSGLNAAERILAEAPEARVVMLTGNPSQEALREAARMGICGFLPKDGALGILLDTLRHARPGNMIVHPSLVARLGNATGSAPDPAEK